MTRMMMWWQYVGPVFQAIVIVLFLVTVVGLAYLWYRVFKCASSMSESACGECGCAVGGLHELYCAGCDKDLREVGIITSKLRGAVSPVAFIVLWTLLMPGFSYMTSGLASWVGPKITVSSGSLELSPISSGQYLSLNIDHLNKYPFLPGGETSLTIEGNASQYSFMYIDPKTMICYDPVAKALEDFGLKPSATTAISVSTNINSASDTGRMTDPLGRQALLEFFKRAGADTTQPDVIEEADELLSIIRGIPSQGLMNLNPSHFTQSYLNYYSYDKPAKWFMAVLLGWWVLVWIGGVLVYFRLRLRSQSNDMPLAGVSG